MVFHNRRTARGRKFVQQSPALQTRRPGLMDKVVGKSHVTGKGCTVKQQDLVAFAGQQQGHGRAGATSTHDDGVVHGILLWVKKKYGNKYSLLQKRRQVADGQGPGA